MGTMWPTWGVTLGVLLLSASATGASVGPEHTVDEIHDVEFEVVTGRASVANNGSQFMAVWEDDRESSGDHNLYASRILPDGTNLDPEGFPLWIDPDRGQLAPRIAYGGGVYLLVWLDSTSSNFGEVRAARIADDGAVLDVDSLDVGGVNLASELSVEVSFGDGVFWVGWKASGAGPSSSYRVARVEPDGTVLDPGGTVIKAGNFGLNLVDGLSIAGSESGAFATWSLSSISTLGWQIQAALLDSTPSGIVVTEMNLSADGPYVHDPFVACSGTEWLVLWTLSDSFDPNILDELWGARVSESGSILDGPKLYIGGPGRQSRPRLAATAEGWLATWVDNRVSAGDHDIYASRISASGALLDGTGVSIGANGGSDDLPRPSCIDADCQVTFTLNPGNFTGYKGFRSSVSLPAAASMHELGPGTLLIPNQQSFSTLVTDGERFVALWVDNRADAPGLYVVEVDSTGAPVGDPFQAPVSTTIEGRVALSEGVLLFVFNQSDLLRAHGMTLDGALLTPSPVLVSDVGEGSPRVRVSPSTQGFMVSWARSSNSCNPFGCSIQARIHKRAIGFDGLPLGADTQASLVPANVNALVMDGQGSQWVGIVRQALPGQPAVSYGFPVHSFGFSVNTIPLPLPDSLGLGTYQIAGRQDLGWLAALTAIDTETGAYGLYARTLSSVGLPGSLGLAYAAPIDPTTALTLASLADGDEEFLAVWNRTLPSDPSGSESETLFATRLHADGSALDGEPFLVSDEPGLESSARAIANGEGGYLIGYRRPFQGEPFNGTTPRMAIRHVTFLGELGESCIDDAACASGLCVDGFCSEFSVGAIRPSATEPSAARTFQIAGAGFTSSTEAMIDATTPLETSFVDSATLLHRAIVPAFGGLYALSATDPALPGGLALLEDAVLVTTAACPGLTCGDCIVDADCLEGDRCTGDLCVDSQCQHVVEASCCDGLTSCDSCAFGFDLNADGVTSITDVQCHILTVLWMLGGKPESAPGCVTRPLAIADADCNGLLDVGDTIQYITTTLELPLDPSVDANQNGCADACEP